MISLLNVLNLQQRISLTGLKEKFFDHQEKFAANGSSLTTLQQHLITHRDAVTRVREVLNYKVDENKDDAKNEEKDASYRDNESDAHPSDEDTTEEGSPALEEVAAAWAKNKTYGINATPTPGSIVEVQAATVYVLLPPPPSYPETDAYADKTRVGATPENKTLEDAPEWPYSGRGDPPEEPKPEHTASSKELARTTWVLFPNGRYQIFVDYPNGLRKVFFSVPGVVYKPGPHRMFVPKGGDPSSPGWVVPHDMVHLCCH